MSEKHALDFLESAARTLGQRAVDRDVAEERSMRKIVDVFNTLHGTNLTEAQGWSFMVVLKQVRSITGGFKPDDYIDLPAYAALEGECRAQEHYALLAQIQAMSEEQEESLPFSTGMTITNEVA